MLELLLSPQAKKFLKKAEYLILNRIKDRLKLLSDNPFPTDVKRIQDSEQ